MKKAAIFTDLIGYETIGRKTAVLTSQAQDFTLNDINGNSVFAGKVTHFGMDKLSGDDVYTLISLALRTRANITSLPTMVLFPSAFSSAKAFTARCWTT